MPRAKRQDAYDIIDDLQRLGVDIKIGWAYNQPRCTNIKQDVDISPRLPLKDMILWLDAFRTGYLTKRPDDFNERLQNR